MEVSLHVQPGGGVRLCTFACASRPQVHLAIFQQTFEEAGWGIAVDKLQLGWRIDSLGLTVDARGDGALLAQEAKRLGMIADIEAQLRAAESGSKVPHSEVETLTGRCLHLTIAEPAALPHMAPMYRMKKARRTVTVRGVAARVPLRHLDISHGPAAAEYRASLGWWAHALQAGLAAPLAPRATFPQIGAPGSGFQFTDAAREPGTGYAGWTTVIEAKQRLFLYINPRWEEDVRQLLYTNVLSMPAGEGIGVVALAAALVRRLPGLAHLTIFTDAQPVASAINSGNSESPQLNFIVRWLLDAFPRLQLLALHQPGKRNDGADGLSRHDTRRVLLEAEEAGLRTLQLPLPPGLPELIARASQLPQRALPPAP